MTAAPFLLARSCVLPDEAYPSLRDLGARLAVLTEGRPTRCRLTAVARGDGRVSGICVRVSTAFHLSYDLVGYAFLPGTLAGNDAALMKAIDFARKGGLPGRFEEVRLHGGPGLAVAA